MTETPTTTANLEAVKASLEEAETALRETEQAAPAAALRVHLAKAEPGDEALLERLPLERTAVDQLRLAVVAAEMAEADRLALVRYKEDRARQRALGQHLGALRRNAEKAARAIVDLVEAYQAMTEAARSAQAVLPKAGFTEALSPLSARRLAHLIRAEITRHNVGADRLFDFPEWTRDLQLPDGRIRTLLDVLSEDIDGIKGRAAAHVIPDPSAVPAEPVTSPAASLVDGAGADAGSLQTASAAAAEPLPGQPNSTPDAPQNVMDLRGVAKPEPEAEEAAPVDSGSKHGWNAVSSRDITKSPGGLKTEVFP